MVECLPMGWETVVQSQVELYLRLKKWYLILPCLKLSIIKYVSRVKWNNLGKGVALSLTPWCSSYWKGSFWVALSYGCQLYLLRIIIIISYLKAYNCVQIICIKNSYLKLEYFTKDYFY